MRPEETPLSRQSMDLIEKIKVIEERSAKAFEEAKYQVDGQDRPDFAQVKVYGENLTTVAIVEKIREDSKQLSDLNDELRQTREADGAYNAPATKQNIFHPMGGEDGRMQPGDQGRQPVYKGIGQQLVEHKDFAIMRKQKGFAIEIKDYDLHDLMGRKTLFQTSAGWPPESVRSGVVVPAVTRPLQVMDIIPAGIISQAVAKYMEETTRTHAAAEKAEGTTYAESTFVLTERTQTVEKITDSIPVTDEQLEDEDMAQSYLNGRIEFGVQQRLDLQIIQGDGNTPNLLGILSKPSIQTQAKGSDNTPDAIFKLMTKLRLVGRVTPTHTLMHPNDWQDIRLLQTADGIYIWGNPAEAGPERLWGLPVVQADSLDENTGIVGSFEAAWIQLLARRGLIVEMGFTGSQFVEGKQTIRASMRTVLVIYRAPAFGTATGI